MNLAWIQTQIRKSDYFFSRHAEEERQKDQLTIIEVEQAILYGRIIKNYSDTGRGLSCLIAGMTDHGKPIHIVCGQRLDQLVIITVYIPKPPKFVHVYQRSRI